MSDRLRLLSVILAVFFGSSLAPSMAIETAEELFVDLDAADASAGTASWVNNGTLGDFVEVGDPVVSTDFGPPAVSFNLGGANDDAYQSAEAAPDGLVGPDPTRSIEVWVLNEAFGDEETLVSWGHRGGGDGTNMSFNYGAHGAFGAVGHWGSPDIGWNDAGGAPEAGAWHHLVYTYDGETTRVYADGVEENSETLGAGVINTHSGTKITLVAQLDNAAGDITGGLKGSLLLGRVRIHDGVLTPEQILANYDEEKDTFALPLDPPSCVNCPESDSLYTGSPTYARGLSFAGEPLPTAEVVEPAGGEISADGQLTYSLPDPAPDAFDVLLRLTNENATSDVSWTVSVVDPPERIPVELAGELFVELHASDASAGASAWLNSGTLSDFTEIGDPVVIEEAGAMGVSFDGANDVYQSFEDAPDGLIGLDPTRSIEVWALNPEIAAEETLLSWGHRGGPDGSNMSFNYGDHGNFGAVGHWGGGGPDLGWVDNDFTFGAPEAGVWHHLVYTYDGETTRVYADGVEANNEVLGAGVINTHPGIKITLAAQLDNAAGVITGGLKGSLLLGVVRIHDDVLSPEQIASNFEAESVIYKVVPEVAQIAGDCNQDGAVNVNDVLCYVTEQFPGFVIVGSVLALCNDPAVLNINGDDVLDLSDTIYLANYLFSGGPPASQGEGCFPAPTEQCDANAGCQ